MYYISKKYNINNILIVSEYIGSYRLIDVEKITQRSVLCVNKSYQQTVRNFINAERNNKLSQYKT